MEMNRLHDILVYNDTSFIVVCGEYNGDRLGF